MVVLKDAMASFDNPSFVLSKNEDVHKKHVPSPEQYEKKAIQEKITPFIFKASNKLITLTSSLSILSSFLFSHSFLLLFFPNFL